MIHLLAYCMIYALPVFFFVWSWTHTFKEYNKSDKELARIASTAILGWMLLINGLFLLTV